MNRDQVIMAYSLRFAESVPFLEAEPYIKSRLVKRLARSWDITPSSSLTLNS